MSTSETRTDEIDADEATPVPERWEFRIGAPVYTKDGPPGTLRQVVIDPMEERVTGLIVRDDSISPQDLLIPLDAVCSATDDEIHLSWTIHEARVLGRMDEAALHTPARGPGGYAAGEAAVSLRGEPGGNAGESGAALRDLPPIRVGLRIEALDGPAGRVRDVLIESGTGCVTHFVARDGLIRKHDRLVPVEWVRSVTEDLLALEATQADLARLPEYRTDEDLQADIVNQWWGDSVLSAMMALTYLDARVRDGVAALEGYAWSRMHKHRLEELALCVRGVLGARNEIVADDELPFQVMEALVQDSRTRAASVRVYCYLGNLRIEGEAPDAETRDAVAEVAAAVPRVKSVVNNVRSEDTVAGSALKVVHPLQPRRGQSVLTRDGSFGAVARVILNPRSRLVAGIVVVGELPARDAETEVTAPPDEWPRRERSVVIPREWIQAVSADEVLLGVGIPEASAASEFRPDQYQAPDPGWEPPFPYEHDEVLLEIPLPACPIAEYRPEQSAPVPVVGPDGTEWPVLARGDRVRCPFGPVGNVDHLLVDPVTNWVAYLVVRGGEGLPKDTLIPVAWIEAVDDRGVLLDAAPDQLRMLPGYVAPQPDVELAALVVEALATLPRRGVETPGLVVRVERGVVWLSGPVDSDTARRAAISAARAVPGVWEVRDELVTEETAHRQAASAAASDPRERGG